MLVVLLIKTSAVLKLAILNPPSRRGPNNCPGTKCREQERPLLVGFLRQEFRSGPVIVTLAPGTTPFEES